MGAAFTSTPARRSSPIEVTDTGDPVSITPRSHGRGIGEGGFAEIAKVVDPGSVHVDASAEADEDRFVQPWNPPHRDQWMIRAVDDLVQRFGRVGCRDHTSCRFVVSDPLAAMLFEFGFQSHVRIVRGSGDSQGFSSRAQSFPVLLWLRIGAGRRGDSEDAAALSGGTRRASRCVTCKEGSLGMSPVTGGVSGSGGQAVGAPSV